MAETLRKIIHIDMDAFFASVEQRDVPEYRDKPLIVGGSPEGRGVVAAASYEVRKYGVHSAMSSARALRLCPHAIVVRPRFDRYRAVSEQIREIFHRVTPLVEPLSLDEAYLDVTDNHLNISSAIRLAREIRKQIREETGLTASAGVSYNKFLAKSASDINKPDGLTVILPGDAEIFLEELEIGSFHGIGQATEEKMKAIGIQTGRDLKQWSEYDLVDKFGKTGRYYYRIVRGIDPREVRPRRIRKSIGKERTFSEDTGDINWIRSFLSELSEMVSASLRKKHAAGKTVTLKVRYDDFETITRSTSFGQYISRPEEIAEAAGRLLEQTEAGRRNIRLLGITLSNLNLKEDGYVEQLEIPFEEHRPHP